jgi:hypothetical protein
VRLNPLVRTRFDRPTGDAGARAPLKYRLAVHDAARLSEPTGYCKFRIFQKSVEPSGFDYSFAFAAAPPRKISAISFAMTLIRASERTPHQIDTELHNPIRKSFA